MLFVENNILFFFIGFFVFVKASIPEVPILALQTRIAQLQSQIEVEKKRCAEVQASNDNTDLLKKIQDLTKQVEKTGNLTSRQIEENKERDAHMADLQQQLDDSNANHQKELDAVKKEHNMQIGVIADQMDEIQQQQDVSILSNEMDKLKSEKDKTSSSPLKSSTIKSKSNTTKTCQSKEFKCQDHEFGIVGGTSLNSDGKQFLTFKPCAHPTFVKKASLNSARSDGIATLLSSGFDLTYPLLYSVGGIIKAPGGKLPGGWAPTNKSEVYNATGNIWQIIAPMQEARDEPSVFYARHWVFACGGLSSSYQVLSSCEAYDVITKKWSNSTPMPDSYMHRGTVGLYSQIYFFGGHDDWKMDTKKNTSDKSRAVDVLDIDSRKWSKLPPMLKPRKKATAAYALGDWIYVCGTGIECNDNDTAANTCERYDFGTNSWSLIAPTKKGHGVNARLVGAGDFLFLVGGTKLTEGPQKGACSGKHIEMYDPCKDKWTMVDGLELPDTLGGFGLTVLK